MKNSHPLPKTHESPKPPVADEIAELADRGEGISHFFNRTGKMMPPILPKNWKLTAFYMKYDIVDK